jgi:RNA polymerase sigma factor (sigma-70 family)
MSPSVSARLLFVQSDARLVELARAGHERAFEALVQRYRRQLLSYCKRLLLPTERAEDALQQGLLQAWLALREGAEVRDAKPWLYRIVHNAALNMLRRSGYDYAELSETLSGAFNAPSEDLDRRIAVREALVGLAALPERQREALLSTAVHGCSYQEAAAMLGLSESTLRGLVHRARATLRAATTALTPSPLLGWALSSGAEGSLTGRVAELGASGGSAGLAGVLLKAGATAVTAGVLAGGISASHRHHVSDPDPRTRAPAHGGARILATASTSHELAFSTARAVSSPSDASFPAPGLPPRRSRSFGVPRSGGRGVRAGRTPRPLALDPVAQPPADNNPALPPPGSTGGPSASGGDETAAGSGQSGDRHGSDTEPGSFSPGDSGQSSSPANPDIQNRMASGGSDGSSRQGSGETTGAPGPVGDESAAGSLSGSGKTGSEISPVANSDQ